METTVRSALPKESELLTKIAFASKRYWQYPEEWIRLWSDELTVTREYIQSNQVFSAAVKDSVVGWYALSCAQTAWELAYFWVLPEKMGRGVGRTMMQHAMGLFLKSQAETITVVSDPHAAGFYLKMGFEKVGMLPSMPEGRTLPILMFSKETL